MRVGGRGSWVLTDRTAAVKGLVNSFTLDGVVCAGYML